MGGLKQLTDAAQDLFWPRRLNCLCCHDPRRADPGTGLCPACARELHNARVPGGVCPVCLSFVPRRKKCPFCREGVLKSFSRCFAPFDFEPVTRALVHGLKFRGGTDGLPLMASAMADSLTDGDYDLLVPVPLHPKRERLRGFNQAALLAEGVSSLTGIPSDPAAMTRTRNTRRQSGLRRARRRANVEGAFLASEAVRGKKVLLVDDVRTTGHTAAACGEALLAAGAVKLGLLTFCVVSRPAPVK